MTKATGATIALVGNDGIHCRATAGSTSSVLATRLDREFSGLWDECVRTIRTLWCQDADTVSRVNGTACRELGIRSVLAAGQLGVASPTAKQQDQSGKHGQH